MSKVDIDACSGDDNYISVQTLVEEANAEYTMLVASNHWGPQGKQDPSGAPEALFTKAELNTLVQKQVSAALKGKNPGNSDKTSTNPASTSSSNSSSKRACFNCSSPDHLKKDCLNEAKKNRVPKVAWKAKPQVPTSHNPKMWMVKRGIGVNTVVFGVFLMAHLVTKTPPPCLLCCNVDHNILNLLPPSLKTQH